MQFRKSRSSKKKTRAQSAPKVVGVDGFKVVAPPASAKRRELLEGQDITTSGGCRTVHTRPAHS